MTNEEIANIVIPSPSLRSGQAPRGSARLSVFKPMSVYISASKTRRLYVGVTNSLTRRVWEHRTGVVPGFSRRYGITRLVYFESFAAPVEATRREKQIKSYARVKKLTLIGTLNRDWHDLAEDWFADVHRADPSLRSG